MVYANAGYTGADKRRETRGWVRVKNLFRHRKIRHKGLAKNRVRLEVLFVLANLEQHFPWCAPQRRRSETGIGTRTADSADGRPPTNPIANANAIPAHNKSGVTLKAKTTCVKVSKLRVLT